MTSLMLGYEIHVWYMFNTNLRAPQSLIDYWWGNYHPIEDEM